jgi:hypothetical protein
MLMRTISVCGVDCTRFKEMPSSIVCEICATGLVVALILRLVGSIMTKGGRSVLTSMVHSSNTTHAVLEV